MEPSATPATGYTRRKERKRSQILTAASELFREHGFRGVSVAQIADLAGVSQVTIYNHFGDKYGLVQAVLAKLTEEKLHEYKRIMTSDLPWMERLRTVLVDKKRSLREFRGEFLEALYREFPELLDSLRTAQNDAREGITYPFLDEGRDLGYVPANITNEAVAAYLQIIARGFDDSPEILHQITQEPEVFDQIFDLITFGLVWNRGDSTESGT